MAEALAGPTDHQRVGDGRVASQHLFDLLDEHLLAAGVHDHRVAAQHHDGAVSGQRGPVARNREALAVDDRRSEEHTSELQSLMRISYAVFCWKKKKNKQRTTAAYKQRTTAQNR